jgi:hypothetical protein
MKIFFLYFAGQYGIPKPFYFPFTKSYWCGSSDNFDRADRSANMELNGQGKTVVSFGD